MDPCAVAKQKLGTHGPVVERRSTIELGHSVCAVAIPFMINASLLNACEAYCYEALCKSARSSIPRRAFFISWLRSREPGFAAGTQPETERQLVLEYRASFLQAQFLRSLLVKIPTAVVAGGFPVAQYLLQISAETFTPGDIDMFLTEPTQVSIATELYDREVLSPQRLSLHVQECITSAADTFHFGTSAVGTAGGTTSIPSLTEDVLRSASSDYAALDSGATQTSTATESSSGSSLTSYGVKSVRGDINNMTMRLIDEVTDFAR